MMALTQLVEIWRKARVSTSPDAGQSYTSLDFAWGDAITDPTVALGAPSATTLGERFERPSDSFGTIEGKIATVLADLWVDAFGNVKPDDGDLVRIRGDFWIMHSEVRQVEIPGDAGLAWIGSMKRMPPEASGGKAGSP